MSADHKPIRDDPYSAWLANWHIRENPSPPRFLKEVSRKT